MPNTCAHQYKIHEYKLVLVHRLANVCSPSSPTRHAVLPAALRLSTHTQVHLLGTWYDDLVIPSTF